MEIKNRIIILEGFPFALMVIINKKKKILVCPVDVVDIPTIQKWSWCLSYDKTRVAGRDYVLNAKVKKKGMLLHRYLMDPPNHMVVDHINGIPFDNRRINLRIITRDQDRYNRHSVKGCSFHKRDLKWQAYITTNKKRACLGYFDTEKEAHQAYLDAKKIYHIIP